MHYKYQRALAIDDAFNSAMGGNRWRSITSEKAKRLHKIKVKADRLWLAHYRKSLAR